MTTVADLRDQRSVRVARSVATRRSAGARHGMCVALCVAVLGACSGDTSTARTGVSAGERSASAPDTVVDASTGTTVATADQVSTTSEPPSTSSPVVPRIDPALAGRVPVVDGFTTAAADLDDHLWSFYGLPAGVTVHSAVIHDAGGQELGRLVIADSQRSSPTIEEYVESAFAGPVHFVVDSLPTDDGTEMVLTNTSFPKWDGLEGGAVVTATIPEKDVGQWAWGADGLLWIVRGRLALEDYAAALIREHVNGLDPYDHQGMIGELFEHAPMVDGFVYLDFPRLDTLETLPKLPVADCFERAYIGYVRPAGEPVTAMEPSDLGIGIVELASGCLAEGYREHLVTVLDADRGWTKSEIGGVEVRRDPSSLIYLGDDVLIQLSSGDPATLIKMGGFIVPFLQQQPG